MAGSRRKPRLGICSKLSLIPRSGSDWSEGHLARAAPSARAFCTYWHERGAICSKAYSIRGAGRLPSAAWRASGRGLPSRCRWSSPAWRCRWFWEPSLACSRPRVRGFFAVLAVCMLSSSRTRPFPCRCFSTTWRVRVCCRRSSALRVRSASRRLPSAPSVWASTMRPTSLRSSVPASRRCRAVRWRRRSRRALRACRPTSTSSCRRPLK